MTQAKPKLVAVDAGRPGTASAPAPAAASPGSRRATFLILALLVLASLGLAIQTRRVAEISGRAERLEAELAGVRAALGGYEVRFGEIQTSVGDLRSQLAELEELVDQPPAGSSDR